MDKKELDICVSNLSEEDFIWHKKHNSERIFNIQDFMLNKRTDSIVVNDCNGNYYLIEVE